MVQGVRAPFLQARPRELTRRTLAASAAALLLVISSGCRSARTVHDVTPVSTPMAPTNQLPEFSGGEFEYETTPQWVGMPLTWEKLTAIETWLGEQPAGSRGFWRTEGELQLHQGRLELARREGDAKIGAATLAARVRSARAGIERVANDPDATEGQRTRAKAALTRADKLADRSPTQGTAVNALASLSVITRATWGAAAARPERMERNKGGYRRITVHHSAEENAPELDGSISDSAAAIRQMQKSHMEAKSPRWGDIGYHFLIDPAGHVFQGRDLVWQGAHADGDNNLQNIGICLIGNFDEERPTKAALDSLRKLLDGLRKQHKIARSSVYGHQDLKSTRCPGRNLEPWVMSYAR